MVRSTSLHVPSPTITADTDSPASDSPEQHPLRLVDMPVFHLSQAVVFDAAAVRHQKPEKIASIYEAKEREVPKNLEDVNSGCGFLKLFKKTPKPKNLVAKASFNPSTMDVLEPRVPTSAGVAPVAEKRKEAFEFGDESPRPKKYNCFNR